VYSYDYIPPEDNLKLHIIIKHRCIYFFVFLFYLERKITMRKIFLETTCNNNNNNDYNNNNERIEIQSDFKLSHLFFALLLLLLLLLLSLLLLSLL